MATQVVRDKMIAQTTILEMGWTKTLIAKFLPEPVLKENPHYKKAAPMKLWREADVLEAMESADFLKQLEKAEKRRVAAGKGVSVRKERLAERATELAKTLTITIIPDEELRKRTIEAKQRWYDYLSWNSRFEYREPAEYADELTMERWIVNFIRHELIDYDAECRNLLYRNVGQDRAYVLFKGGLLKRIEEVYPKYAEECERQMESL